VKAGAVDFITKDPYLEDKLEISVEKVERILQHALDRKRLEDENRELRATNERLRKAAGRRWQIVGDSQAMRMVMTKIEKAAPAPAASQARNNAAVDPAKKAKDSQVAQAFRATALKNAVSGLLKGGMTSLLAQSDFVAGTHHSANVKNMFNTRSQDLQAMAPNVGAMNARDVKVGTLGGEGSATGKGKGVGYGKGEHAGVGGQGKSLVSLDTSGSNVEEGLTKDEVGEVIHRHMSEIRYCYEAAMIRTTDVEGKLMVNFTIGGNGMVKTTAVKQSTLPDPRLDDCVLRRLVTWKFPLPKGGIDVAVTYPFIFKTLGR
jgi:TonB family protein